ncbi:MAG: carboxypeptidase regulatory-like domain-containing protein [Deltaproteobacteria bacterium]|nr:carboxypeptidase regulatory-like domain-containing protein [Deltaproteobacteria bacterium]
MSCLSLRRRSGLVGCLFFILATGPRLDFAAHAADGLTSGGWRSISAGGWHTVAVRADGSLWAWGNNADGQVGDGTTTSRTTPTLIIAAPASSGTISGGITESFGGAPLSDVVISTDMGGYTTITDADGNYSLSNVAPGTYTVTASKTGYQEASASTAVAAGETRTLDLVLTPATTGAVVGVVTADADSTELAGILVCADGPEGRCSQTASDGSYSLSDLLPGSYRITALGDATHAGEYWEDTTAYCGATLLTVSAGQVVRGIDFGLAGAGSISGTVVAADTGLPLANIWVCTSGCQSFYACAMSDASGSYRLIALPAGTYQVDARPGSDYVLASLSQILVAAGADTDGVNFRLALSGSISGTIVSDGTGAALGGIDVCAEGPRNVCSTTAADGTFVLDALAAGPYRVHALGSAEFASEYWDDKPYADVATLVNVAAAAAVGGIDFRLTAAGSISGTVLDDSTGLPIAGVWVCTSGVDSYYQCSLTDVLGQYLLTSLPAGTYQVDARPDNGYVGASLKPILAVAGTVTADVNFRLVPGGAISGTVVADGSGASLGGMQVCALSSQGKCATVQPDGTYAILGLVAGDFRVFAVGGASHVGEFWDNTRSYEAASVLTVAAGQTMTGIDFSLALAGSITGTVVAADTGAPLAGAQVHVEDGVTWSAVLTDASGAYTVSGLSPGSDYQVTAVGPEGHASVTRTGVVVAAAANTVVNFSLPRVEVTGLRIDPSSLTLWVTWRRFPGLIAETSGGDVTVPPESATWSSSDPAVAQVQPDGQIIAVGKGVCNVFASRDGFSASLHLTVNEAVLAPQDEPIDPYLATPASGHLWEIPVVSIRVIPTVDGVNVDPAKVGDPITIEDLRSRITDYEKRVKFGLEERSRFRGYKNAGSRPSLGYRIVKIITVYEPLPPYTAFSDGSGWHQPDYYQILSRFDAEDWVKNHRVKEFWVWGYHYDGIYPVESDMSSPTTGDVSNSYRLPDDLPVFDRTYTLYGYNYMRTQAEALHNHGHQIEALMDYVSWRQDGNTDLFWKAFGGRLDNGSQGTGRAGNCHCPPNTGVDYDYLNPTLVWSDCEDWTPDNSGQKTQVNVDTWANLNYAWPGEADFWQRLESQYYLYWWQNMPGWDNEIRYGAEYMTNWWRFTGDWDGSVARMATEGGLHGPKPLALAVMSVDAVTGHPGESVGLRATLSKQSDGSGLSGKVVTFRVGGAAVGDAVTDGFGVATCPYGISGAADPGPSEVLAEFAGDPGAHGSSAAGTLSVVPWNRHWSDPGATTSLWSDVHGTLAILGSPAQVGDEVAVFDPQGVLCGHAVVAVPGDFGVVRVYGDDPATSEDEGASPGDALTFEVWSAALGREFQGSVAVVSGPATWSDGGSSEVNLSAGTRFIVPLRVGWNLISFPLATCWHLGNTAPAVPLPTGTATQGVAAIRDVLSSIDGKYAVVRSFDETGAHSFDPALPDYLNDLTYLAGGYGYWIKMTEAADLELEGLPLNPEATLPLNANWNLVGYWGNDCRHVGDPPTDRFGPGTVFTPVARISDILQSVADKLIVVRSFDAGGAHTYNPTLPDYLSDLTYLGPGYGYWVKVREAGTLGY